LAVSGSSYVRLHASDPRISLSPLLSISWPILLAWIYGIFLTIGIKESTRPSCLIWIVCIGLFLGLILWSSLIWLHEQGLRMEMEREPTPPEGPRELQEATKTLPKME
jgi:hypothetical protein